MTVFVCVRMCVQCVCTVCVYSVCACICARVCACVYVYESFSLTTCDELTRRTIFNELYTLQCRAHLPQYLPGPVSRPFSCLSCQGHFHDRHVKAIFVFIMSGPFS
jgi:hypothetical protein